MDPFFSKRRLHRRDAFVALLLLAGGVFWTPAACDRSSRTNAPQSPAPVSEPVELTIAFTGNAYGLVDPCGCVKKQLGGLARRGTLLEQLRKKVRRLVYVDYGAMLFPKASLTDLEREQRAAKAKLLIESAEELELAAYTPGGSDFGGGTALLKELLTTAPFEVVSANLFDPATGEPLFAPHTVLNVGGLRLGVTGVSEDVVTARAELRESLEVREPLAALEAILPELRARSDRILVLARAAGEERIRIAALEGVDFVLGWPEDPGVSHIRSEHNAVVGAVSDQGQRIGVIETRLEPGRRGYYRMAEVQAAKEELRRGETQAALPRIRANAEALETADRRIAEAKAELAALSQKNPYEVAVLEVSDEVEPLQRLFLLVDDFRRAQERSAAELYGEGWESFLKDQNRYAGAQSCRGCHQAQYDFWIETRHASAFATLEKTHQSADQSCIRCHTTGYASLGGFQGGFVPKLFRNVQCESCHGPSAAHARAPAESRPPWEVNETRCRSCHGTMHDERFDYAEMLPKVTSPDTGLRKARLEREAKLGKPER